MNENFKISASFALNEPLRVSSVLPQPAPHVLASPLRWVLIL